VVERNERLYPPLRLRNRRVVWPPLVEPLDPLLQDPEPLLHWIPLTEGHVFPRQPKTIQCPPVPRSPIHQHSRSPLALPQDPPDEHSRLKPGPTSRDPDREDLPGVNVDGGPEVSPPALDLDLGLVNGDDSPRRPLYVEEG